MTRDGLIEVNETQQTAERISSREADSDFSQPDSAAAERVIEHLDAAHTRKANKKEVKKEQEATALRTSTSRLQFTEEERATPELETYIKKSEKAADRLDAAKAAIPKQKKLVKERTFDEAAGKAKTRLHFEEQEKPIPGGKAHSNPLSRPAQEAGIFVHNKIHSVEKDNSGAEGAHKSEELAERGARYGTRKFKQGYRSHKLKPYREAAKAEKAAFKANVNFQYHKVLQENPQLTSNPFSRFMQKQKIKGRRFLFFLHNYVAVVGRVPCGRLCGCALCIGRDRKTAHKDKGGTKGSHGLFQFILHLHFPPVLRSLPLR